VTAARVTQGAGADSSPWRRGSSAPLRVVMGLVALGLFLASCGGDGEAGGRLLPFQAEAVGAPTLSGLARADGGGDDFQAQGGESLVLRGSGFTADHTVWLGEHQIGRGELEVAAEGTELRFTSPPTEAGAVLDVAVGLTEMGPETETGDSQRVAVQTVVVQRVVLSRAYPTTGLRSTHLTALALVIGAMALLGAPLFLVIASVACVGLLVEVQGRLEPGLGFFSSVDSESGAVSPGLGVNFMVSWLSSGKMGSSPLFIAIPLFTFAGTLLSESRAPARLIDLCRAFIGWLPGGLALVTLVACCFVTAFTGASGVTIVALGGFLFPILLKEGYPERFSLGLLTTGGSLGLLFPPALPVIVYGYVVGLNIELLYLAALIPGVLLVMVLFVTSFGVASARGVPRHPFTGREVWRAVRASLWDVPLPFLVVGGIYSGVLRVTEASAVAACYVLFTTVAVYRDIKPSELLGVVRRSSVLVGAILLIIGMAMGFSDWLDIAGVPQKILAAMRDQIDDRLTFLIMLNLFLLAVGCLMDIFSAILVVVPLITPLALEYGVDPFHLAVIFLVNLEIGYSTPPVGINLFIASLRFRRPVFALYRASLLFIAVLMGALLVLTYIPGFSLFLFDELPAVELPAEAITVVEGESNVIVPSSLTLGGVDQPTALERMKAARKALADAEEAEGKDYADLDDAVKAIEREIQQLSKSQGQLEGEAQAAREKLQAAVDASQVELMLERIRKDVTEAERQAATSEADRETALVDARARLELAVAERATLQPLAEARDEAKDLLNDLKQMHATLRWRSRLDGSEQVGPEFDTRSLAPGVHIVSVTVTDPDKHIAQAVMTVTVEPAPEKPEPEEGQGGQEPDGSGGGDGEWEWDDEGTGDDGGDDWGWDDEGLETGGGSEDDSGDEKTGSAEDGGDGDWDWDDTGLDPGD
jgi:C4-dicarboxylate transporter, DctM subunit